MGGKAKPTKHTSKELAKKNHEATVNRGGGAAGHKDRLGGAAGHSKFQCPLCGAPSPSLKSMQIHHEAKHPTVPWDESAYEDKQAAAGGTTKGVAVRGSVNKNNPNK